MVIMTLFFSAGCATFFKTAEPKLTMTVIYPLRGSGTYTNELILPVKLTSYQVKQLNDLGYSIILNTDSPKPCSKLTFPLVEKNDRSDPYSDGWKKAKEDLQNLFSCQIKLEKGSTPESRTFGFWMFAHTVILPLILISSL